VEEQFYLLWPFIVVRRKPAALLWVCAGAVIGALLARGLIFAAPLTEEVRHDALYMFTISRMDALALGAAAAAIIRIPRAAAWLSGRGSQVGMTTALMLLATTLVTRGFGIYDLTTQSVGYTFLSAAFALMVLWAVLPASGVLRSAQRILESTPLRLIGRYSYGMYIFHLPLHVFVGGPLLHRLTAKTTPGVALTYIAVMLLASFALAALSYELFERRFLDLKRHLIPVDANAGELSAR
jgi:peptidoglycan/LPS O-acetylase OafA/YrhL